MPKARRPDPVGLTRAQISRLAPVGVERLLLDPRFPAPFGRRAGRGTALVYDSAAVLRFLEQYEHERKARMAEHRRQKAERLARIERERQERRAARPDDLARFWRLCERPADPRDCWRWKGSVARHGGGGSFKTA